MTNTGMETLTFQFPSESFAAWGLCQLVSNWSNIQLLVTKIQIKSYVHQGVIMYIPLAQASSNNVTGRLELNSELKKKTSPLLDLSGKLDRHLNSFCDEWPEELRFFVDISPMEIEQCKSITNSDEKQNHIILKRNLNDPNNGFINRNESTRLL